MAVAVSLGGGGFTAYVILQVCEQVRTLYNYDITMLLLCVCVIKQVHVWLHENCFLCVRQMWGAQYSELESNLS